MMIDSVGSGQGAAVQAGSGMTRQSDPVSRNIQAQIGNAQKRLQELSSNDTMSVEEKMKKRQEIQKEIASLNQQLRQHQIEKRKEQRAQGTSMDDMLGCGHRTAKKGKEGTGLSQAGMQAMISADSSMKVADAQGSVAVQMDGQARVLQSEIRMDRNSGVSTEEKEAQLADLQAKAQSAETSQISTLAEAGRVIRESGEAEEDTDRTTERDDDRAESRRKSEPAGDADREESMPAAYEPVNILL